MAGPLVGCAVRMRAPAEDGRIYLSFDDGPHPEHTGPLLDVLAEHDAKATFFVIGAAVARWPHLVQRIVAEGHAVGGHSMTHRRLHAWHAAPMRADLQAVDALLYPLSGRRNHLYRPPHGRVTPATLLACAQRRQPVMLWNVNSMDYRLDAASVVERLQARPPVPGDVVLMHDDQPCAGQALRTLLPVWAGQGMRFAALT